MKPLMVTFVCALLCSTIQAQVNEQWFNDANRLMRMENKKLGYKVRYKVSANEMHNQKVIDSLLNTAKNYILVAEENQRSEIVIIISTNKFLKKRIKKAFDVNAIRIKENEIISKVCQYL